MGSPRPGDRDDDDDNDDDECNDDEDDNDDGRPDLVIMMIMMIMVKTRKEAMNKEIEMILGQIAQGQGQDYNQENNNEIKR